MTRVSPEDGAWSVRTMENGGVTSAARDPNERLVAVGGRDGSIRFLNPVSARRDEKKVLEGHAAPVTALAYDDRASALASGDEEGVVHLWRVRGGRSLWTAEGRGSAVTALAVHRKGEWLAAGFADGSIVLHGTKDGAALATLQEADAGKSVSSLVVLDKGSTLAAAAGETSVSLWDLSEL